VDITRLSAPSILEGGAKSTIHTRLGIPTPPAMADPPSTTTQSLIPLDLSSVSPTTVTSSSLLSGIITIKWPYSSSAQKLTFLLAEEDPRKRARGGQVKITLLGKAAEHLDQIESGEEISIAATVNTIPLVESESATPRVKFHLTFSQGCILIVPPPYFSSFFFNRSLICRRKIPQCANSLLPHHRQANSS
jgi:hypothetical protein